MPDDEADRHAVVAFLKAIKPSRLRCCTVRMPAARCLRFGCANAGEAALAAVFVLLLLSLAHSAVVEVPHDPAYTRPMPMPLPDDDTGCVYHFLSVDVENPNQLPLRAETRAADGPPRLQLSPGADDKVFIGRAIAVTNMLLPSSSGRGNLTDDALLSSVGASIGKLIVVLCYRHAELPTDSGPAHPPVSDDFTCFSTFTDAVLLDCFVTAKSSCSVRAHVDLVVPRSMMLVQEHSLYEFHVYAEMQGCSDASAAVSPARLFRFFGAKQWIESRALPGQGVGNGCACPNHAGPCVTYPQDGSMLVRDKAGVIIAFNGTEPESQANPYGFMIVDCIDADDVFYRVQLNGRLLKSFHARNVFFESGESKTCFCCYVWRQIHNEVSYQHVIIALLQIAASQPLPLILLCHSRPCIRHALHSTGCCQTNTEMFYSTSARHNWLGFKVYILRFCALHIKIATQSLMNCILVAETGCAM